MTTRSQVLLLNSAIPRFGTPQLVESFFLQYWKMQLTVLTSGVLFMFDETVSIIRYKETHTTTKNIAPHTTMYFFILLIFSFGRCAGQVFATVTLRWDVTSSAFLFHGCMYLHMWQIVTYITHVPGYELLRNTGDVLDNNFGDDAHKDENPACRTRQFFAGLRYETPEKLWFVEDL